MKNRLLKSGFKKLVGWIVKAWTPLKNADNFMFSVLFSYIFLGSSKATLKDFFHKSESISKSPFFYKLKFNFQ